ncbi:hypothetical protein HDK64DRAFT_281529 [Phyllosticta capitalensis]
MRLPTPRVLLLCSDIPASYACILMYLFLFRSWSDFSLAVLRAACKVVVVVSLGTGERVERRKEKTNALRNRETLGAGQSTRAERQKIRNKQTPTKRPVTIPSHASPMFRT